MGLLFATYNETMPGAPQDTSFIPKNNTTRRKRTARQGNVYVLSVISYIIFLSALGGAGAVFFYDKFVIQQLEQEVIAMNSEVSSFKEADMQQVIDFDQRLQKASDRIDRSVSVASIFDAIEAATADTVRFSTFSLTRNGDENFTVEAEIETNTFDSTLFQRGVFARTDVVDVVEIKDLLIADVTTESGQVLKSVSFMANLAIPLGAVPYTPPNNTPAAVVDIAPVASTTPNGSSTSDANLDEVVATETAAVDSETEANESTL